MAGKSFVGDIGTIITLNVGANVVSATERLIKVKKPSGTEVDWTASQYKTNSIRYTIVDGDFNEEGTYTVQAYVVMPTWEGLGEVAEFTIFGKWKKR